MNKKYYITFGNQNFQKQLDRLKQEATDSGWFDGVIIETPDTTQCFHNQHRGFITANSRGHGYWIWKPYIILRQLREMQEGDYLFYTDAGASILEHRRSKFNEYIQLMQDSDTPIITFAIHDYYERELQKPVSLRKFGLEDDQEFLNSGQVEGGIVMCRKTPFVMKFMEEWLDHLLENDYELAHDFDCTPAIGYRHDQSILSILCKQYGTLILSGANAYGMGPFFSGRMVDSGQRTKGPDLFRMQLGYNSENPKHITYDSWLHDSDFVHYFSVPNIGNFSARFDVTQRKLIDAEMTSGIIPKITHEPIPAVKPEWNYTDAIPVIGTAVVNSTKWVERLIDSVDFPVENFVIVNNNGRGKLRTELDRLSETPHPFIKNIHVVHMPANAGVSTSWNLIIKWFMQSPYWIICNDDVAFGKGLLEEFYRKATQDPEVGLIHAYEGEHNTGSWDLFLIKDFIIQKFGLFDENLYPAYAEDLDYLLRFIHNPIKKIMNLESVYYHGDGFTTEYHEHGSQTAKTEPELIPRLNNSNETNFNYMFEKWGPFWRTQWPYEGGAFNKYPVNHTTYDLEFVRKKHLGF